MRMDFGMDLIELIVKVGVLMASVSLIAGAIGVIIVAWMAAPVPVALFATLGLVGLLLAFGAVLVDIW